MHLERFRRHKAPVTHDQLRAGRLVIVQMRSDLAADHVALALNNARHVGRDGTGHHTELRTVTRQMRDPRAPNLVLAGQTGVVGAGAADPAALDDDGPPPRLRHIPTHQIAALAAAEY